MRYVDAVGPLAIAHRGGAGLAPENTLEAFGRSYALGLRFLETDVRRSHDGRLVAYHDAHLHRISGARGRVRTTTWAELAELPVLTGGPVLELEALLAAFPRACFTLDVKEAAVVEPLAALLASDAGADRVCVAAARGRWLAELRDRVGPQLSTALSWRELARLTAAPRARYGDAAFAHVPLRLGRVPVFRADLVARGHDAGVRVIVWTVNDPTTMHRLLDSGVDGIITDRPDQLREVLVARGQWHTPDSYDAAPDEGVLR